MKYDESSLLTKQCLAAALKARMAHKPLSRITVSELAADCGLNRKTFYYHFADVYALFKWMLEQETFAVMRQYNFSTDYQHMLRFAADYVFSNREMIASVYASMGVDSLKRIFYDDFIGIADSVCQSLERDLAVTLQDDYRTFLCEFYSEAVIGVIFLCVAKPDATEQDKEKVIFYLMNLLESTLPQVIRSAVDKGLATQAQQ